jgi:hypothetical protein
LLLAGCVGTNPAWEPPPDAMTGDEDDTDASSSGEITDGGGDSTTGDGAAVDETAAGRSDGSSGEPESTSTATTTTGGEMPVCDDGMAVCDGECKDIAKDKHACGAECIDCTVRFGNQAKCEGGECEGEGEGKSPD